jgi:hypothetical protein
MQWSLSFSPPKSSKAYFIYGALSPKRATKKHQCPSNQLGEAESYTL